MNKIINIEAAEKFIYNFEAHRHDIENQTEIYSLLRDCELIATVNSQTKLLAKVRILLTEYFIQINDLENALKIAFTNKDSTEQEGLEEEQLNCYSGLLRVLYLLGDYSRLEEFITIYRDKLERTNNQQKLCSLNIISAIQYYTLKEYSKCFEANEKALEYAEKTNDITLLVYIYNNYGSHCLEQKPEHALELLNKCIALYKKHPDSNLSEIILIAAHVNLANLHLKNGDYRKCNKCLDTGISIAKTTKNNNLLLDCEIKLTELFIKSKKYDVAKKMLLRNKDVCKKNNDRHHLLEIYKLLQEVYSVTKEFEAAYLFLNKYMQLKDEIFNEETLQKIKNLQILNEVREIKQQRDHAERLARLKHDFLANMSHEIRTPINSVLGICYLLQQGNLNTAQQKDYLTRLENSGNNLLHLINEVLDISKIEADKIELINAPFSFHQLLTNIILALQPKADEKNIDLILKISQKSDPIIIGDENRISQILTNIISNSIKFTQTGSVTVTGKLLPSENPNGFYTLQCTIKDTGIGIPQDRLEKIFERYEQAITEFKTQFGGTGLGLAISKKLTDLMNGHITVESKLNKGTSFTISIPVKTTTDNVEQKIIIDDRSFLDNTVFVIADDLKESRKLFKEVLLQFNDTIKFYEAKNGHEALELTRKHQPDVVFMDLDMPILNGFEAIHLLRNSEQYPKNIVIAHTACLLAMGMDELTAMGFNDLLTKPFRPNDLLIKLQTHLKQNKSVLNE